MPDAAVAAPAPVAAPVAAPDAGAPAQGGEIATPEAAAPSALERAKKAADKAAEASRKRVQAQVQETERQRQAQMHMSAAQQAQREAQELRKQLELAQSDPLEAMLRKGMTPQQILKRLEDSASPEAKAMKAQQDEMAALRDELKNIKAQAERERALAKQASVEAEFIKQAGDESVYPTISQLPPRTLMTMAMSTLRQANAAFAQKHPGMPIPLWDNHEILLQLESEHASHAKTRMRPAATEREAGTDPSPATKSGTAPSRSVTNANGTERSKIPDPGAYPAHGTDREQKAWMAADIKRRIAEAEAKKKK